MERSNRNQKGNDLVILTVGVVRHGQLRGSQEHLRCYRFIHLIGFTRKVANIVI